MTVENFLPFKGSHTIDFSTDNTKNVTIVMGDNGSGKTSLAQAFEWCLYGKTSYSENSVLNAILEERLAPGSYTEVVVEIKLIHDQVPYTITRKQRYSRKDNGDLEKPAEPELTVTYKEDGETKWVPAGDRSSRINELLSSELSHYFFFDGEHVKNMRSEIESGKSSDFANAVKSILGLRPIGLALGHLKATGNKQSVVRSFQQRYNKEDNEVLVEGTEEIARLQQRIESAQEALRDQEDEAAIARQEVQKDADLLKEHSETEEIMRNLANAKKTLAHQKKMHQESMGAVSESFSRSQYQFFAFRLLHDVLNELADQDKIDKGVPDEIGRAHV